LLNNKIRNICIYGLGGVGGYFGGKMAYQMANTSPTYKYNIYFIARGKHLMEINNNGGLILKTDTNTLLCPPLEAVENFTSIPSPDLCLLCVKSYHLESALYDLEKNIHEHTIILPLLNGVDIYERIRPRLSKGFVLPSCLYILSSIAQPGVIRQTGAIEKIICGYDPQMKKFNPKPLIDFFKKMKLNFCWKDDPFTAIWEKFILVASTGIVNTAADKTMGEVLASPVLNKQLRDVMAEVVAIAHKNGLQLNEHIIEKTMEKISGFPPDSTSSYQRDMKAGRSNEGDLFAGTIIKYGEKLGVPTPLTAKLYKQISN